MKLLIERCNGLPSGLLISFFADQDFYRIVLFLGVLWCHSDLHTHVRVIRIIRPGEHLLSPVISREGDRKGSFYFAADCADQRSSAQISGKNFLPDQSMSKD